MELGQKDHLNGSSFWPSLPMIAKEILDSPVFYESVSMLSFAYSKQFMIALVNRPRASFYLWMGHFVAQTAASVF